MARVETRIEDIQRDICEIKTGQKEANANISNILLLIAEGKGAARVSKWIFGILVTGTSGVVSWFCGKAAIAAKVGAVVETGIHLVK